jgi:hypothetical protein
MLVFHIQTAENQIQIESLSSIKEGGGSTLQRNKNKKHSSLLMRNMQTRIMK